MLDLVGSVHRIIDKSKNCVSADLIDILDPGLYMRLWAETKDMHARA